MNRIRIRPACLLLLLGVVACVQSWSASPKRRNPVIEAYIISHHGEALRQQSRYGVPASIKMAQGVLETGGGKSTLASVHNNHFGIKCHNSWRGARTYRTDDAPNECFRSYERWQDSYEDHSTFLRNGQRYRSLFSLDPKDYQGWARGLQKAGYATNPGYANNLIRIIEEYELYALDRGRKPSWMTGGKAEVSRAQEATSRGNQASGPAVRREVYMSYGLPYVLARRGDSLSAIARDMDISTKKLGRYNEMPEDFPLNEGDIVYLKKKNSKASRGYDTHVVQIGDSMHSIAQRYGMRMDKLYKLNGKGEDYSPVEGEVLRLR